MYHGLWLFYIDHVYGTLKFSCVYEYMVGYIARVLIDQCLPARICFVMLMHKLRDTLSLI